MKDNLFEALLHLFEKSLTELQESQRLADDSSSTSLSNDDFIPMEDQALFIKFANQESIRIFTYEEQMKLTKASYQFLMKMKLWNTIDEDDFETVIDQLQNSDSNVVTLEETKWTIRNVLATYMDDKQRSFLDLILYRKEDDFTKH